MKSLKDVIDAMCDCSDGNCDECEFQYLYNRLKCQELLIEAAADTLANLYDKFDENTLRME